MISEELNKSIVESATLAWLESFSWVVKHGAGNRLERFFTERDFGQVVLERHLCETLLPKLING